MVETHVAVIAVIAGALLGGFLGFTSTAMLSSESYDKGREDGYEEGYMKGVADGHSRRHKEGGAGQQNEDTEQ